MRSVVNKATTLLVVTGFLFAGCSTVSSSVSTTPKTTLPPPSTTVPPTTTTTTEQPGWTPVSTVGGAIAVDSQAVTEPDGHVVTVFRFRAARARFALHAGSTDPPVPASAIGSDSGPAIGPDDAPALVAAFNGGFKTSSGSGGFELDSRVIVPLQAGVASLVIDANGSAHVGIWDEGLPTPGEQVVSVRQNLAPLVANGQTSPSIADIGAWGSTLGGGAAVARSSLGEDTAGDLIYAASMDAVPNDLASALISTGGVTGMELDINPEWVQLASASTPGGTLTAGIPGQNRPSDQYQVGWTRDFVTVLANL